jgi:excisionase family DNA binding protein
MTSLKTGEAVAKQLGTERATLSIKEAAHVLGVGKNQMYAAVRAGEVPVVKIGSRLLVSRAILERMLLGEQVRQPCHPPGVKLNA